MKQCIQTAQKSYTYFLWHFLEHDIEASNLLYQIW
jgi:hypothetical protein